MAALEAAGLLDRASPSSCPATEEIAERRRGGRGLERPELAVLLAYAKRALARELLGSDFCERPVARARPARVLPEPRRRALRPPAGRAPAAARAGGDGRRQHGRQLARPDVRVAARGRARRRAGRRRPRLPHRARGDRRRRALGRGRAPPARHRPRRRHGAHGRASTVSSRRRRAGTSRHDDGAGLERADRRRRGAVRAPDRGAAGHRRRTSGARSGAPPPTS